jgi:A/G-specific adenine glycosylase
VWYKEHKRDLPWRRTKDPYCIWVSEIILQQTRVNQGLNYYNSFTKTFPAVFDLANATEDEVLLQWQGLGYYSRARNMHATAKLIVNEFKGIFPKTYTELIKLKGIGPYTAAAISSICYNEHRTVVDGNVFRVLTRIFGIHTPINTTAGKKEIEELAHTLNNSIPSGDFNQALMEFGAIQCTPKQPLCNTCIYNTICEAYNKKEVALLPQKQPKTKIKHRYLNYIFIYDKQNNTLIQKRNEKDIWKGLYQLPLYEQSKPLSTSEILNSKVCKDIVSNKGIEINKTIQTTHILSHQKLHITFVILKHSEEIQNQSLDYIKAGFNELQNFAFPKPIQHFITHLKLQV